MAPEAPRDRVTCLRPHSICGQNLQENCPQVQRGSLSPRGQRIERAKMRTKNIYENTKH